MKYIPRAGWSSRSVRVPLNAADCPTCHQDFPPRLPSKFVLTCLSPSILGTTSAASLCSGVWGSGSAAAPPSPASTASRCKASEHRLRRSGETPAAMPALGSCIQGDARIGRGLSPRRAAGRFACSVGYSRYLILLRSRRSSCCQSVPCSIAHSYTGLYQMKTCPLFLISGFALLSVRYFLWSLIADLIRVHSGNHKVFA